jgi:hypothetical protein
VQLAQLSVKSTDLELVQLTGMQLVKHSGTQLVPVLVPSLAVL